MTAKQNRRPMGAGSALPEYHSSTLPFEQVTLVAGTNVFHNDPRVMLSHSAVVPPNSMDTW